MFNKIVTHNDFDGIVSAAICSAIHEIETIEFTGPNHIQHKGYAVTANDIVCDLPYVEGCGLWFDHHEGNLEEVKRLGKEPSEISGSIKPLPSCARVIYEFYKEEYDFPNFYEETVIETDRIDTFDYKDVNEWRAETAARIINDSLKHQFQSKNEEDGYLRSLVSRVAENSLTDISKQSDVKKRYESYCIDEIRMIEIIGKTSFFHPLDNNRELVFIDLTGLNKKIQMVRNLAQITFPSINGVYLIQNIYDRGVKTTSFTISGSLTIKKSGYVKNIGETMRILNIGDGHKGAGSGQVLCNNKNEMDKKKGEIVAKVIEIWQSQIQKAD